MLSARTCARVSKSATPLLKGAVRFASNEAPFMAQVKEDLKTAMRSGDNLAKTALRELMSEVRNANIAKAGSAESDVSIHGLLDQLARRREKSIKEYESGGRSDLAESEKKELEFLRSLQAKIPVATSEQIEERINELLSKLKEAGDAAPTLKSITQALKWPDVEREWQASRRNVIEAARKVLGMGADQKRQFSAASRLQSHSNPLGLPRRSSGKVQSQISSPRPIPNVKHVILVSSAKGGVGKSTVAVNMALALSSSNLNVGILDVDIFGPSLPTMLGLSGEPKLSDNGKLVPLKAFGLQAMSMGFLVPPERAVAWRGLLVQKALQQLLLDVEWGELDYLVVDMPPGTGDVQLTITQMIKIDGVVVVTTPQDVALIDARRGIDMFKVTKTPVLGIVQNMAVFQCPHCHQETHIFGHDGAKNEALRQNLPLLGSVPLTADIALAADAGEPIVMAGNNVKSAKSYEGIAQRVLAELRTLADR